MNFPFIPPGDKLEMARIGASSRYTPRAVPWISPVIGGGVILLFVALVAMAFFRQGLAAWGTGLVYIFYDTCLLGFTGWQTRGLGTVGDTLMGVPHTGSHPIGDSEYAVPTLAVIIAAHNEERALSVTIDALTAQSDPPDLILIADDGSTDGSAALLQSRYGLSADDPASITSTGLHWLRLPHEIGRASCRERV